jgi:hypothetical protein
VLNTDNKIIALIGIVIILVAGVVAFNYMGSNSNNNNTTVNNVTTNTTNVTAATKVVANQTGPATAKKGDNVTINYSISNLGSHEVFNVKTYDQNFETTIGSLKAGETQNFQYTLHIPTDEEIQEDFGPNATVSNPFFIGGFGVSFTDLNGSTHTINANSLEIKLV